MYHYHSLGVRWTASSYEVVLRRNVSSDDSSDSTRSFRLTVRNVSVRFTKLVAVGFRLLRVLTLVFFLLPFRPFHYTIKRHVKLTVASLCRCRESLGRHTDGRSGICHLMQWWRAIDDVTPLHHISSPHTQLVVLFLPPLATLPCKTRTLDRHIWTQWASRDQILGAFGGVSVPKRTAKGAISDCFFSWHTPYLINGSLNSYGMNEW